jgi:cytochrome c-type biogenesis protein CcmF
VARLVWRNKRRYAGYIVHVGVVIVFFGIAGSAAYQKEKVQLLDPGQHMTVDRYLARYESYRLEAVDDHIGAVTRLAVFDRESGRPIGTVEAEQRFHPNMLFSELREAFMQAKQLGEAGSEQYERAVLGVYDLIGRMEQHLGREVKTPSTEVGILASLSPGAASRLGEDFYVIPLWVDPLTGQTNFRVFVNPMVNLIWFGGLIFVVGSLITILPDSRERRQLQTAMEHEERAVA